jgi:hypothetical protein
VVEGVARTRAGAGGEARWASWRPRSPGRNVAFFRLIEQFLTLLPEYSFTPRQLTLNTQTQMYTDSYLTPRQLTVNNTTLNTTQMYTVSYLVIVKPLITTS